MTGSFVLRGGRVIDTANGVDRIADLVIGKDKILGLDAVSYTHLTLPTILLV